MATDELAQAQAELLEQARTFARAAVKAVERGVPEGVVITTIMQAMQEQQAVASDVDAGDG
jgi:hypothetical protein